MRFSVFSKRSSTLALALALGMGGVLSVTALEAPAAAQKKKKDDDKAAKPQYSKGFVAVYNPVQQLDKDGDVEAVKAALPGVIAASLLVFIPTVGDYVTPSLVGGPRGIMIGNIIQSMFGKAQNWPLGAAISVMSMITVTLMVCLFLWGTHNFRKRVA